MVKYYEKLECLGELSEEKAVLAVYVKCIDENNYVPVICVSGPLGAGDTWGIAGLKCRDLTADESRQCRRWAEVLISR